MDQQVMELLAKIFQSQTEMRGELSEMRGELSVVKGELSEMRGELSVVKGELSEMRGELSVVKGELSEMRGELSVVKGELSELKADQETLAQRVAKLITVVEHDLRADIRALYDFREVQLEHNYKTDRALERIEAKVEALQLETSNLKRIK